MASVSSSYLELGSPVQAYLKARETASSVASAGVVRASTTDTYASTSESGVQQLLAKRNAASYRVSSSYVAPPVNMTLSDDDSPIVRAAKLKAIAAQAKEETTSQNQENFLRMKAFEISKRIQTYKNLGLTAEYEQAQAEGVDVVKKYQQILQKKTAKAADAATSSSTVA